jgi:multidrug resistance protein
MFAPGVPAVLKDFGTTNELLATFVVSVYLLGFAFGPLFIAPLSEMYGRYIIYMVCNILFVIFAVACGLAKNMGQLIVFRFLHGVAGVSPLTIGGGSIADMMPVEKRGGAMAVWAMGPLLGPVFGPVAGGYLVESKGWQWVFWLLAIMVSFPEYESAVCIDSIRRPPCAQYSRFFSSKRHMRQLF